MLEALAEALEDAWASATEEACTSTLAPLTLMLGEITVMEGAVMVTPGTVIWWPFGTVQLQGGGGGVQPQLPPPPLEPPPAWANAGMRLARAAPAATPARRIGFISAASRPNSGRS